MILRTNDKSNKGYWQARIRNTLSTSGPGSHTEYSLYFFSQKTLTSALAVLTTRPVPTPPQPRTKPGQPSDRAPRHRSACLFLSRTAGIVRSPSAETQSSLAPCSSPPLTNSPKICSQFSSTKHQSNQIRFRRDEAGSGGGGGRASGGG